MLSSFAAELLKLRKRPATWVLGFVWVILVLMFGYFFTYSFVSSAPAPSQDQPAEVRQQQEALNEELLDAMLPENLLENLFANGTFGIGAAIALILGALAAGSEYGWGTLKTSLTQRPGRLAFLLGKVLALVVVLVVFVLLGLGAGALGSFVIAGLEGAAVEWPPPGDLARAAGVGGLIFGAWGFLGFALATLFKGTALAIGLGLAWALAVENTIALLPIESDAFEGFRRLTLGENTAALGSLFGDPSPAFGIPEPLVEPGRAAITLALYSAAFVLLSAFFLKRRDVT